MQVDRIRLSNFKSIPELDLNFQEMNGLWEINGVVGAGKTSIGEAILYALFGSVRGKTNESLIMWGKKHALVEAWLYCRNTHIYIRREINAYGQSPLTATAEGEEIIGSDKRSIQGILETEWYDVSRQTLELLCVISFNNFKSLSTLNTQESRDFLNSTISFDKLTWYEDWCKEQIRGINDEIQKEKNNLIVYETTQAAIVRSNPEKPKYDTVERVDGLIAENKEKLTTIRAENTKKRKFLRELCDKASSEYKLTGTKIKDVKVTLKKLNGAVCPLCGQPVDENHRHQLELELTNLEARYREQEEAYNKESKRLLDFDLLASQAEEPIVEYEKELLVDRAKVEEYRKSMEQGRRIMLEMQEKRVVSDKRIEQLEQDLTGYQDMIVYLKETVRPTIISSIIPNINTYIDQYMKLAHQNYVVRYDDNFKCMMKNPYGDMIPISSLSTGQKKVIDMIIILAFIKTFITQIDFNIYFLDELIGNIDADLRDTMCGLLRNTLEERDVMFLISHSPINQQYLDGAISVVRQAGTSQYNIMQINKI